MRTLLTVILLLSLSAFAQIDRVIAEAQKPSPLAENLRVLTDEIGGRVPGTPAMDRAIQWAQDAFRAAGADSVKTESFTIPASWSEGATAFDVTAPVVFRARAVSLAWTPPLPPTRARIVDLGKGSEQDFAAAGNLSGAVILIHSDLLKTWDDLFNEYLNAPPVIQRATAAHAVAIAFISSREHDILYRHINTFSGKIQQMPQVLVAREDGERIARLLKAGKPVSVSLSMPNRIGGPITTSNVIAELRGSEKPAEFVILGAHLDSWELGTGALDNGCNSALVIDALRAIKASGARPRRSIRFILFSGEEQGILGSAAYALAHRAELDRAAAVVIFDSGTGRVPGFSLGGRKDVGPALAPLLAPLAQWKATEFTFDAPIGTDNFDFLLEGVPTLIANQEEANYMPNYHATSDTYDKVDFTLLKQNVAIAAAVTFAIADASERIGPRQTRPQVEQLMKDTGLDQQMKTFALWDSWTSRARGRQ